LRRTPGEKKKENDAADCLNSVNGRKKKKEKKKDTNSFYQGDRNGEVVRAKKRPQEREKTTQGGKGVALNLTTDGEKKEGKSVLVMGCGSARRK